MNTDSHNEKFQPAFNWHTDTEIRDEHPHSVLIFPALFGHLVWVRHPERGWEVPGGKVEPNETPDEAARREAFEEAGLVLDEPLLWLGEYQFIDGQNGLEETKWVFFAEVLDVKARPSQSEIMDVRRFVPHVPPNESIYMRDVSPVMKDMVYKQVWSIIQDRLGG